MLSQPEFQETPLNRLHNLIDRASARIGGLERCSPAEALDLLTTLDEIDAIYTDMSAAGANLRAEDARRETIRSVLQRKAGVVLNKLGGQYAAQRARRRPAAGAWWWRLDEHIAQQRRLTIRSLALTLAGLVAIVAVLAILFNTVLKGDPLTVARLQATQNAQAALDKGDPAAALQAIDSALASQPGNSELLMWRGVILARIGRTGEAEADFASAKATYASEADFLTDRATLRIQAGDAQGAATDAEAAVKLSPDNAQAVLTLGTTQELRGQYQAAMESYTRAGELASAQKNVSLEAFAKVKMATLLQAMPVTFPSPRPTQ